MERQLNDLETHFLDLAREISLLCFTLQSTKLIQRQPEEGDDNFETLIWVRWCYYRYYYYYYYY